MSEPLPLRESAIEIRGDAEPHFQGGESINPRFPNFKPKFLVCVRPHRIVSWGLETAALPCAHPNRQPAACSLRDIEDG